MAPPSDSMLTEASAESITTRLRIFPAPGGSLDNHSLPHHHAQIRLVHHKGQASITLSTTLSRKSKMSNETSPPSPPSPTDRRASFVPGQKLSELFGKTPTASAGTTGVQTYPGSIAAAAANAQAQQRRRMSISTLGLSGSPTQTSPFTSTRPRQESYSSNGSGSGPPSVDESAIEEGEAGPNNASTSPFARRMSFGARALRDVKGGNGSFNGRASTISASSPNPKGRGEGFNWSEQLRTRAQRSSSITSPPIGPTAPNREHQRAASLASVEAPIKEIPKAPKVPDHFQERILKGDFYMD